MNNLFALEHFSRDAFRVKRAYIDITGDLTSGILLGQIIFWNLPNENGKSKLKVVKENELWLAKGRTDWHEEIRITPKQFDRSISVLRSKGFVETKLFKFNGTPTIHIKLNIKNVEQALIPILPEGQNPFYPMGEIDFTERDKSLTEITTNISSSSNNNGDEDPEKPLKPEKPKPNVFLFYQQNFGILGSYIAERIGQWVDDFDGNEEVVIESLKIALENQSNFRYAEGIMKKWHNKGVRNLDQANAYQVEFKRDQEQRTAPQKKKGNKVDWDSLKKGLDEDEKE